ncbi:MAG: DnaJ domain-containing protein, partial [Desulfarculus sp.]|nr:DnaJ domain-containing protein [Desulfarculus sp.]
MPHATFALDQAYAALGLAPGAGLEQVKAAYRRLARELHPDLNPQAPAGAMARINAAHGLLLRHLKPGPEVSPYRFADWAPRTGQRDYRFDQFGPGSARPFGPQASAAGRQSGAGRQPGADRQSGAGRQSGTDRQSGADRQVVVEPPLGPLAAAGRSGSGPDW